MLQIKFAIAFIVANKYNRVCKYFYIIHLEGRVEMKRITKKILSCCLAFSMVVTGSQMTFYNTSAEDKAESEGVVKQLPLTDEDGYTAFLSFADATWTWSNFNPSKADAEGVEGYGHDAVITGNGTYTVSIDRASMPNPDKLETAESPMVFRVDFEKMATASNFDISEMKVKNIIVKCDGKVFPTDESKMYFGDIEGRNNLNLEICNVWGYGQGDFCTKDEFDQNEDFAFSDSLSVTFTLEGIKEGKTSEDTCHFLNGDPIVWALNEWNEDNRIRPAEPTEKPEEPAEPAETTEPPAVEATGTPRPVYTPIPEDQAKELPLSEEDGYTAFLIYADPTWSFSNFKSNADGGNGHDAVITGDGTYTVSLKKEDLSDNDGIVEGVTCLMVDFKGMAEAQNFDISQMKVKDVVIKCDGKAFPFKASKTYFGDIEGMGSLRMEFRNEWGYSNGDFYTKEEFDPNERFAFEETLSVTFTLEGIQKGNTWDHPYYDEYGESVVSTLGRWNADQDFDEPAYPTAEPVSPTMAPAYPTTAPAYPTTAPVVRPSTPTPRPVPTLPVPVRTPSVTMLPVPSMIPPRVTSEPLPPITVPTASGKPEAGPGQEPAITPGDVPAPVQPTASSDNTKTTAAPTGTPNNTQTVQTTPAPTIKPSQKPADDQDEEYEEEGEEFEDEEGDTYTVTQSGKKAEVEYSAPKEEAKGKVKIPSKVTINGVDYKVTSVASNAFKNNDKVKQIVLNDNIKSIGNNAFKNCKKLKKITITSTKLTKKSVSKNAFKGISGNVVIKVPKGKKAAYKKLFRSKGLSKKVRII